MVERGLVGFFENFVGRESVFLNKKALQSTYTPDAMLHRNEQIQKIAEVLAPSLRKDRPSNIFIYGKTGAGKTLCVKHVTKNLTTVAAAKNIPLMALYVNCKLKRTADTEYRLLAQLASMFGKAVPPTGLPTDEIYKIFYSAVESKNHNIILVLDEIDQLVRKAGDGVLYNLTRINDDLKTSQISIVGISNDLMFAETLDPRVRSSLSEEEVIFPPYNAMQIRDILRERAKAAIKPGVLQEGVIEKCAAYAARDHGDARRAIELLRVSAETAERKNQSTVTTEHIDEAEQNIEKDRIFEIVEMQPKQYQATLYAIISLSGKKDAIFTGEIYDLYKGICSKTGLRPLTQRRISDVLAELDVFGIINARVISKGRYGRTREISTQLDNSVKAKITGVLRESLGI